MIKVKFLFIKNKKFLWIISGGGNNEIKVNMNILNKLLEFKNVLIISNF